ncbi:hypothetical protein S40285_07814 [Stachybotrys chlorohalonatus IBT 40285]|uniref:Uncharacterized protein n=1 Tax=Stachybotrys chlorohalonatus (strain IBT 40285) TaxID=1283841 RepID=A0A084Q9D8_STAC4|nr:hypothetical protein S40285_07814 [Stachybotrys chlorohalonata IBT 40285]
MVQLFEYILGSLPAALARDIFVSPGGNIQSAVNSARTSDTIYLRAGTNPCMIAVEADATVIIHGGNMPYTPGSLGSSIPGTDRGIFHVEDAAAYRHFTGITPTNRPYGVYVRNSNNCRLERLTTHHNY